MSPRGSGLVTPDYWDEACRHLGKRDRVMRKLIPLHGEARLESRGDAFTTLARSIVGQQISVKAAQAVWQRFRALDLPAIFPYLVTGWVTAAGGAWNASIVAEYVTFHGDVLLAYGLGSRISLAAASANFAVLAASILVMSAVVVGFNRTVWRSCYRLAEARFSLTR